MQIDAKTYSIQRTISLPDKQTLEREANAQYQGIGGELKKKLNRGVSMVAALGTLYRDPKDPQWGP